MDGNIYNNISKEINFKLPDINFDSDSEDENQSLEPLKPYIRPAPEVLFGNPDSSDDEEILEMLRRMPAPLSNNRKEKHEDKMNEIEPLEKSNNNDKKSKLPSLHCELPYQAIQLPNGIKSFHLSHLNDELSSVETVRLSGFGMRDNIDIDRTLDELDFQGYENEFFDGIIAESIDTNNSCSPTISAKNDNFLLKKLDEMAKQYNARKPDVRPNIIPNVEVEESLASLFLQAKKEASAKLVVLDLRGENETWEHPDECDTGEVKLPSSTIEILTDSDSSTSSDSENDSDDRNDLWIGNYRRAKEEQLNMKEQEVSIISELTQADEESRIKLVADAKLEEDEIEVITLPQHHYNNNNNNQSTEIMNKREQDDISNKIKQKIETIKRREHLLAERRKLIRTISQYAKTTDSYPLLLHEDISFDTSPINIVQTRELAQLDKTINNVYLAHINMTPPYFILTQSKLPIPLTLSLKSAQQHFITILTLILSSTQSTILSPNHILPFHTMALHQVYHQNQLQLILLISTPLSITKLKTQLNTINMKEYLNTQLPSLPLSHIIKIQPYDANLNHHLINPNKACLSWYEYVSNKNVSHTFNHSTINTSCLIIRPQLYLDADKFHQFIQPIVQRFAVAGLRIVFEDGNKLVMGVRGHNAVETIKKLQNSLENKEWICCTRFEESSTKELSKYFGARVDEISCTEMLIKHGEQEGSFEMLYNDDYCTYNSLYWCSNDDVLVIVSPLVVDVGWILDVVLSESGSELINISRLPCLSVDKCREIGIDEWLIDVFSLSPSPSSSAISTNEPSNVAIHCLTFRCEQPALSVQYALDWVGSTEIAASPDQLFYLLPYSAQNINVLEMKSSLQMPCIRELIKDIPLAPTDDCEQLSFILLVSQHLTKDLAQLLDQISHLDLLAVKCCSTLLSNVNEDDNSNSHSQLIISQFNLPPNTRHLMTLTNSTAVLVVRSMFIIKELTKIQQHFMQHKANTILAFTLTFDTTFRMIGSFFTSTELVSDSRRRTFLRYLPRTLSSELSTKSLVSQFPIVYSSLSTALSVSIDNKKYLIQKLRKLWFLLTREQFHISKVRLYCNSNNKEVEESKTYRLIWIVDRPNAIFYLIQWANTHFPDDTNLRYVKEPEEIEQYYNDMNNIVKSNELLSEYKKNDYIFVTINVKLLESSVEQMNRTKYLWAFLDDQGFITNQLNLINIDGGVIFKLKDCKMVNINGHQITQEGLYLCLLLSGSMAGLVTLDLMRSKFQMLQCHSSLSSDIYLSNDIEGCCDVLI